MIYMSEEYYSGSDNIMDGFREHFELLARTPENTNFDQKYHETNVY